MELEKLSREEKVGLLKDLSSGKLSIIGGEIVDKGVVLIEKDGLCHVNKFEEGKPGISLEEFKEQFKGDTMVILPYNGR